jgi:uncharacterized protein YegP (UPF0339 family)
MPHEVFEGKKGQHYFHVKAANGQIVAASEGYANKSNAERGYRALLDAVHPDVLAELRAGTIVESPESVEAGRLSAPGAAVVHRHQQAFLDLIADAIRFEEDPDENTLDYTLVVSHRSLTEFMNALGLSGPSSMSTKEILEQHIADHMPPAPQVMRDEGDIHG